MYSREYRDCKQDILNILKFAVYGPKANSGQGFLCVPLQVIKDDQIDVAATKKIVEKSAVDKEELALPFYLIDKCGEIKDKDEYVLGRVNPQTFLMNFMLSTRCELAYKLNLCMIEATKEWNSNSTSDDLL